MSVRIRLQRRGRKQSPLYHIIIADSRAPRDGKFIEKIGVYNPLTKPATIEIDRDKAFDWLMKGAEPTDTVRAILRFKGVMYRKHLSRGVTKGAMTQEEADTRYAAWIGEKEELIAKRRKASTDEIADFHSKRSGIAKAKPKVEEPVAEEAGTETTPSLETAAVPEAPATEETTAATEESAPASEETTAATVESAPATDETTAATVESAPATDETTAATEESAPATDETTAATEESAPATDENTAATEESAEPQAEPDTDEATRDQ